MDRPLRRVGDDGTTQVPIRPGFKNASEVEGLVILSGDVMGTFATDMRLPLVPAIGRNQATVVVEGTPEVTTTFQVFSLGVDRLRRTHSGPTGQVAPPETGELLAFDYPVIANTDHFRAGGVYCAVKAAVETFSESLRIELGSSGVKVGIVAPGSTKTEIFEVQRAHGENPIEQEIDYLEAEDIARAVRFMLEQPNRANVTRLHLYASAEIA